MDVHRLSGTRRIAGCNRISDFQVLLVSDFPHGRILDVPREPLEVRIDPLIEKLADEAHQHCIIECRNDRNVELPIQRQPALGSYPCRLDDGEYLIEAGNVGVRGPARRLFRDGAFDERARPNDLERPFDRRRASDDRG